MTIKSPTNGTLKGKFPLAPLTQWARELVRKRPGIYKGNLIYWLQEVNPNATGLDFELTFNQLQRQGYFFSYEDTIHPPNTVDEEVKQITKYISKHRQKFTDYGILYELHHQSYFTDFNRFSREVVSKGWSMDEWEVKSRLNELIQHNIITTYNGIQRINWEHIREALG